MPSRNIPPSPDALPTGAPETPPDAPAEPTPRASIPDGMAPLENPLDGLQWPATEVELVSVTDLVPYARNARTHSDEQIAQIMASIREWGFTTPILRDETGMVIAGHGRLLAAQRLKLGEVPVVTARGWSEAKKRAYVIADNKLALNAGWDEALLGLEFAELDREGFDLDLLGFDPEELARILGGEDETPPESSSKEIDPDDYVMGHTCPKCGFEFDDD